MTATITDQARLILGGDETALVELRAKHPRLGTIKQHWYGSHELDYLEIHDEVSCRVLAYRPRVCSSRIQKLL